MSLGSRIKYFRNLRGMTQNGLGLKMGFSKNTASVRIAQYESDSKEPRENVITQLAEILDVSPKALTAPDTDSIDSICHTLFLLEDLAGFRINKNDKDFYITLSDGSKAYSDLLSFFSAWYDMAARYHSGEITLEEYDQWRYMYPETQRGGEDEQHK